MLNAIKPLIKIAKERYRQNQLTKLQTQQNIIKSLKINEEGAIANTKAQEDSELKKQKKTKIMNKR